MKWSIKNHQHKWFAQLFYPYSYIEKRIIEIHQLQRSYEQFGDYVHQKWRIYSYTYLMTKNAAILDTKMAVTFELLALEQKGKVFWMYDTLIPL